MPTTQSAFDQIKQGVGSFLGNLDREFQNYTQPARNLANNGGLVGQAFQRIQTLPQQFQAIQQSIPAPQINSRPYNFLQNLANFQQKLPTPQRVTQDVTNFTQPVIDYSKDFAQFVQGQGSKAAIFAQAHPSYPANSPEFAKQSFDMAMSFGGSTAGPKTSAILAKKFPVQTLKTAINDIVDKAFSTPKDNQGTVDILGRIMNKVTEGNPTVQALKALKATLNKKLIEVSGAPGNYFKSDYAHVQKMKKDSVLGPVLDTLQTHITTLDDMIKGKSNIKVTPIIPTGKIPITPVTQTPKVIIQLPKELQGAKPRYGYGSNLFQLKFQSDIDKSLYIVAQSKPSARDAEYLRYLQGIFPELSVSEIRQMGQKLRNTVIKPLAANGEGDILNIPSFSDNFTQGTPKAPVVPDINPNPTSSAAWEQSLVDSGIAPKTPPVVEPPVVKPPASHVQTADEFAASQKAWEQQFTPKEPVPGMQFEPGAIPETPPNLQADISKIQAGGKGGVVDSVKQAFADWVNARRASRLEGYIKSKDFQGLDSEGLNGIFKFQAGESQGLYGKVKEFFDAKYSELQNAGLTFNYKSDYLPQLWGNTQEEIDKVFGNRRLGLKPSFAFNSIIKDYQTGIAAGLTPRFQTISELAGWYEGRANRALADLGFFKSLSKEGFIVPSGKAPRDWVTLEADRFPKFQVSKGDKVYSGTFKAPKEVATLINDYLRDPQHEKLAAVADFTSAAKNRLLSFGISTPWYKTAINFHGFNTLARHLLFGTGGNPITRALTAVKYMVHPESAQKYIDQYLTTTPRAVKAGVTFNIENHTDLAGEAQTFLNQFGKKWNEVFEMPLFEKMIPALKLSSFNNLVKNGMKDKNAATIVNNVYGGINWETMGRNRDVQNFFRVVALTPDWLESTGRLGGNLAKSFVRGGEVAARYRTMMATLFGSVVALNVANKLSTGHFAYENEPGHAFELDAGYASDGQKRYIRPYGTAIDFVRLPVDIGIGIANGDYSVLSRIVRNRLSPPAGAGLGVLTDTNYAGQPIGWKGKDRFGNEMPLSQRVGGIGSEIATAFGSPAFLQQGINTLSGKQGMEQGLLQGLELPLRYSGGAYSKSQKTAAGVAKAGGASGEELYKVNQAMKGVSLSKNQEALLRQEGIKILPDILQLKDQNSTLNAAKKVEEEIAGGNITEEAGNKKIEGLINHLETPKKQTDAGFVQTAQATSQGSFGPTPIASNFPEKSLVGGSVYSGNSLVGTAMAADSKSVIQNKLSEQLARAKVQLTGKPQEANGQYFYLNEKGNVASVLLDRPIYQAVVTGDPVIDKLERSDMAASYTAKINDIQSLYRAGRYSLDEYKAKINELYAQKAGTGMGGKGKKLKLPKLKISKPKGIKMKAFKFTPVRLSLGKISGGGRIQAAPRLSRLSLSPVNVKFKTTQPQLFRRTTNYSSRGGSRGFRRGGR